MHMVRPDVTARAHHARWSQTSRIASATTNRAAGRRTTGSPVMRSLSATHRRSFQGSTAVPGSAYPEAMLPRESPWSHVP
jgi:hypothetical protein